MPRPKDETRLLNNSSELFHINSIEPIIREQGYEFLKEINVDKLQNDVELLKYIGCDKNTLKEIKEEVSGSKKKNENIPSQAVNNDTTATKAPLECVKLLKRVKKSKIKTPKNVLSNSSKSLCELKDVISCPNDNIYLLDHSENPGVINPLQTKVIVASSHVDLCKSGFFFINNVFYNDMRLHQNIDYSRAIFDWIERRKLKDTQPYSLYTSCRMELTKFGDLSIRIGYPYVY
ncbi:hypothetical protein HZS_320, partial [Henneguya salminicola]